MNVRNLCFFVLVLLICSAQAFAVNQPAGGKKWDCDKSMGALDHITVEVNPVVMACTSFRVVAVARDCFGDRLWWFNSGTTWSDAAEMVQLAAPATFKEGVMVADVVVPAPVNRETITISAGGKSGTSIVFNVTGSGPVSRIDVHKVGNQMACTGFTGIASARDYCGNVVRSFNAPASWSRASGVLHAGSGGGFVNGVAMIRDLLVPEPYSGDRLTVESGGHTVMSNAFEVSGYGAFDRIAIEMITSPQVKKRRFVVKATAVDACGNRISNFNSSANWNDSTEKIKPDRPSDFVGGVSETTARIPTKYSGNSIKISAAGKATQSNFFDVAK